jgi:hypothetical protein
MAILVDTSAVQGIGWSAILGHYTLEESYLSILYTSLSTPFNPNKGLEEAAKNGHVDLVEYFVSQGANDWNLGMSGAALGGHMHLVKYFVSRGANDWNWTLLAAAEGGHMDIVEYFVSKRCK